ncbi:kinesin-domain-containing protein [Rickenella mellea]|uniref:Kinesin-like protein n=1 Tax=Rickenella mellea TaxID=50990 RepID=A0A4Y7QMX3_9AGAM|nr:kinesin-domain-containing protein [Rickenella mellea]
MTTRPKNTVPRTTRSKTKNPDGPSLLPAEPPTRSTRASSNRTKPQTVVKQVGRGATADKPVPRTPLAHVQNQDLKSTQPTSTVQVEDGDKDTIKAYLRIRPTLGDTESSSIPYLKSLTSTSVQMSDPSPSRIRSQNLHSVYTFTHVFPPETRQSEFFTMTTLPLVRDLVAGQNGLVFTYGVTNSGKTYTIQGGDEPDTAGILPRTLDVVFNSLEGQHSNASYRPLRMAGVERVNQQTLRESHAVLDAADESFMESVFADTCPSVRTSDTTTVTVDRNYEYSVWVSYIEVYNEKIYDLLSSDASDEDVPHGLPRSTSSTKFPSSTSTWQNIAALAASSSLDVLLVKRKALALKNDPDGGKFVAGLREVHVRNAEDAKAVFRMGNIKRRVFGTLANSVSSRSHGIFTIKVLKIHKGAPNDIENVSSSRLSIVDLAGSERSKNTQNTGDRLKEAGNINKSLMVLGQCMEALRNNQKRQAASLATPGRGFLDPARLGIVPFRHSRLTELFQDFFVGDSAGRAVMIVNVNPYDTGFDENSHVMKFAALAKDVTTSVLPVALAAQKRKNQLGSGTSGIPTSPNKLQPMPTRRKVTISTGGKSGKKISEAVLEVVEEDEEGTEESDEPMNPLVDALFDEIERLHVQLYESEMRSAVIEAETREEVMRDMEERMLKMERMFARRLMNEVQQNELKTDAKIDMLHQFGNFAARARRSSGSVTAAEVYDNESIGEQDDDEISTNESESRSPSPSPSAGRDVPSIKKVNDIGPNQIGLLDDDMAIDEIDADDTMTIGDDDDDEDSNNSSMEGGNTGDDQADDDEDDEDWEPSPAHSSTSHSKPAKQGRNANPSKVKPNSQTASATPRNIPKSSLMSLSNVQKRLDLLSLHSDDDFDARTTTPQRNPGSKSQDPKTQSVVVHEVVH